MPDPFLELVVLLAGENKYLREGKGCRATGFTARLLGSPGEGCEVLELQ